MIYQHMWFSIANMLTMSYHLFRPLAPSESEQTPKGSGRRGSGFLSFLGRRGAPKTFKDRQKTTKEPRLELIESIIKHAHFRSYPNNIGLHSTRWCNFGHSLIDDSRPHIWVKREVRSWHGFLSLHGEDRRGIIPKWPNSCHLVMTNIAMRNGPFIDGLPIKNGWIFHGYVK